MRILIDMQAAQAANKKRGIGNYTLSLTKALITQNQKHDILLLLSAQFEETLLELYEIFTPLLPSENIKIFHGFKETAGLQDSTPKAIIATQLKQLFIESLNPDMILVMSFFEGFVDDAVSPPALYKNNIQTLCIVYDLIPLLYPELYLQNPDMKQWYLKKIEDLRTFDRLLAISASTREELIQNLALDCKHVVNISTGREERYRPIVINQTIKKQIFHKYNISKPYIIYTGGMDPRKNIPRLIKAFSTMPQTLLSQHQLVIVCEITPNQRSQFTQEGVLFTGYVDDEELVALYNLAKAAIFPSLHEGFGLPILEAMQCQKAVIGSRVSSIPEVIGFDEALFDPYDIDSITQKMVQVLSDKAFRVKLQEHSKTQILKFSWQRSANKTLTTLENLYQEEKRVLNSSQSTDKKLAYISPLPPLKSGISNYSAELLPYLNKYYNIDIITDESYIEDDWISTHCTIRSVEWFELHHLEYERIIYHFGNSHFHTHMFDLLQKIPGIVVLHDFFLSGIIAYIDTLTQEDLYFEKTLFHTHGYRGLQELDTQSSRTDIIWKYPLNLAILQNALGVITHSQYAKKLAADWYGQSAHKKIEVIPLLRETSGLKTTSQSANLTHLKDVFLVCSFGLLGSTKLNHRLLEAYLASSLAKQKDCYLVFVGESHADDYGNNLLQQIQSSPCKDRISITGWIESDTYYEYLSIADLGVQLRCKSRGETSAAVLDCMNYSLPTIVNENGSMADLPSQSVYKIPDHFTTQELINGLEKLYCDKKLREKLAQNAKETIQTLHNPKTCAHQYYNVIEHFYDASKLSLSFALEKKLDIKLLKEDQSLLVQTASSLSKMQELLPRQTQLLVDISELIQRDAHTGIQRVVKNIINQLFFIVPDTMRIELIYATIDSNGYIYAREFTSKLLNIPQNILEDLPVEYHNGDIFLGLDLQPHIVVSQQKALHTMKVHGVKIYFVIYDLLCVKMPHYFSSGADDLFTKWLYVVSQGNGAISISKAVMQEFKEWRQTNTKYKNDSYIYDWFYLGVDHKEHQQESVHTEPLPDIMTQGNPNFLMVGTLEPRKGHQQVLKTFEELWSQNKEINLIIVGKQGWMVEQLVALLQSHPLLNKRLLWLQNCSDSLLERVYKHSTCLIAASEGEGFGLPIIEAMYKNIPIIARDIPVFREIATKKVIFFQNNHSTYSLKQAINQMLQNGYKKNNISHLDDSSWSWKSGTTRLFEAIK